MLLTGCILLGSIFAVCAQVVYAQDEPETAIESDASSTYQPRSSLSLDDTIADTAYNEYSSPSQITVIRVDSPLASQTLANDPEDWLRGIYYYAVTKLLFTDLPFNYVVTWQGNVYEGKLGGRDVQPPIAEAVSDVSNEEGTESIAAEGRVLIAYLSDGEDKAVSDLAAGKMGELVLELMNQNAVKPTRVEAAGWEIADQTEKTKPRELDLTYLEAGDWYDEIEAVVDSIENDYDPVEIEYEGTIEGIEYDDEVESGGFLEVTVTAKNTGEWVWYSEGTSAIYVATSAKRGHESDYYSEEWASFSRIGSFGGERALPDDEVVFKFKLRTPLAPGEYDETFELISLNGQWLEDTQFEVSFTVTPGDEPLVLVLQTNTGFLNVRKEPGLSAEIITSVDPGDYYVLLDKQGNWYKIRVDGETEGWAYAKYLKEVE